MLMASTLPVFADILLPAIVSAGGNVGIAVRRTGGDTGMRTVVDVDQEMLAFAKRRLGTETKHETINRALAIAASVSAADRERGLTWLAENAERLLRTDAGRGELRGDSPDRP